MVVVKKDFFKYLNKPIANNLFGKNKTWRGFIFVPVINALLMILINSIFHLNVKYPFYLGVILGMAYILFELPNSFLKRKLGILPGEQHHHYKILFSSIDKMDSAFGVNFTYFILGYVNYQYAFILFLISILMHISLSKVLVQYKLKKSF